MLEDKYETRKQVNNVNVSIQDDTLFREGTCQFKTCKTSRAWSTFPFITFQNLKKKIISISCS